MNYEDIVTKIIEGMEWSEIYLKRLEYIPKIVAKLELINRMVYSATEDNSHSLQSTQLISLVVYDTLQKLELL
jgi:hypothetical protein